MEALKGDPQVRRGTTVLGLLVAAGMIAAAPASAGTPGPTVSLGTVGGFEYLKATFEDVVSQAGAPILCDDGDEPSGGGGTISGSGKTAALNSSYPFSGPPGDGWQAEGSTTGAAGRTVTTYAICGPAAIGPYGTSGGNLSPAGEVGDVATVEDVCEGDEASLAGFRGSGGDVRFPLSRPDGVLSSWSAIAQNLGDEAANANLYRTCTLDYDPVRRSEFVRIDSGESGKVTARCKKSEAVINGGFASTVNGVGQRDTWVTSTRPYDSGDRKKAPDDGWRAKAQNSSDEKVKLTVHAVCQPK
jgi:hypothetical protein